LFLWQDQQSCARMAKLVDAPGLGPDASNGVGVRVPFLAPRTIIFLDDFYNGNCSRKPG
jgi:hypothetical protein